MSSISLINPKADLARAQQSLQINSSAARGLQDLMATNLGPRGTMKMLVSGGGESKITKDGSILLSEMQIQHPTAALISKIVAAQDDLTGDGTTSTVLLIGEFLKLAESAISEGLHVRSLVKGFSLARDFALSLLNKHCVKTDGTDRQLLSNVARTSLSTKVAQDLVPILTETVVDAVLSIKKDDGEIDLHMIEIMEMCHKVPLDTRLVRGLVMDHGGRHPNMPKTLRNAFILTCNVSLEYEKTEINSGAFYKSYEERAQMVIGERKFIDDRVRKIIDLKNLVCADNDKSFVVFNQKGIDLISLEMLAQNNVLALRRTKRRNMERIVAACGGSAVNSFEDLRPEILGYAGLVREFTLGDSKFTFVEDCPKSGSSTILINGQYRFELVQIKDAIRDGLRAVHNCLMDKALVPGAGAIEIALHEELMNFSKTIAGKEKMGVSLYANGLLIIPRVLSKNSGLDPMDSLVKLSAFYNQNKLLTGLDLSTGDPVDSKTLGVYDNLCVKRQNIIGSAAITTNLLLVDEIIRAGVSTRNQQQQQPMQ